MSRVHIERSATNDAYTVIHRVSEAFVNDPAVDIRSFYTDKLIDLLETARADCPTFHAGDSLTLTIEVTE